MKKKEIGYIIGDGFNEEFTRNEYRIKFNDLKSNLKCWNKIELIFIFLKKIIPKQKLVSDIIGFDQIQKKSWDWKGYLSLFDNMFYFYFNKKNFDIKNLEFLFYSLERFIIFIQTTQKTDYEKIIYTEIINKVNQMKEKNVKYSSKEISKKLDKYIFSKFINLSEKNQIGLIEKNQLEILKIFNSNMEKGILVFLFEIYSDIAEYLIKKFNKNIIKLYSNNTDWRFNENNKNLVNFSNIASNASRIYTTNYDSNLEFLFKTSHHNSIPIIHIHGKISDIKLLLRSEPLSIFDYFTLGNPLSKMNNIDDNIKRSKNIEKNNFNDEEIYIFGLDILKEIVLLRALYSTPNMSSLLIDDKIPFLNLKKIVHYDIEDNFNKNDNIKKIITILFKKNGKEFVFKSIDNFYNNSSNDSN